MDRIEIVLITLALAFFFIYFRPEDANIISYAAAFSAAIGVTVLNIINHRNK